MKKNLYSSFIVIYLIIIWIILFPANTLADETYNLGVALGLSGSGFLYCSDGIDAINLAAEEINAQGGFLGKYPVKLFIKDTKTQPDIAAQEAENLIKNHKVQCILGTYSSDCAVKVRDVCRQNRVIHIAGISNSENITKTGFSPYTFSVVPNSYMQARAGVIGIAKMAKQKGWKQYVTIASDYDWGRSTQNNTVEILKKESPELILKKEFWPALGEIRFNDYIMAIIAEKPDFIYGSLASKDNFAWMSQAKAAGLFKQIPYPGSLISVTELIVQAKNIERGMIGLCRAPFFAHMDLPLMENFVKTFREKYKRYPSDWAVLEYDSVYVLKQGIEKAGSIDNEKVKEALTGASIETCRGKLDFRRINNQLSCSSYIGIITDDPKYPFPVYKDIIEVKGSDSWRPESEILAHRQAE
ncbi:Leucine-binding domain-containing protein [Desulfonema limicola]|uniref:Leucine-binding domain-containing protein n=1 Tax=Desulfonema limicola TaxID=45656 RepID=A0A975B829_9BACT|nr:ABC transporter substrate-binding protein [Desulfonema limicola]QTA80590.1 Leucine-binding domain-containing protein [Desulfonema limicola]